MISTPILTCPDRGLQLLTQIIIADITTLKWRAFVSSIMSAPFLVNGFVGANIATNEAIDKEGRARRRLHRSRGRCPYRGHEGRVGREGLRALLQVGLVHKVQLFFVCPVQMLTRLL